MRISGLASLPLLFAVPVLAQAGACSRESPRPAEAFPEPEASVPSAVANDTPGAPSASSPPAPLPPPAPLAPSATMQLLDAGRPPRQRLRYAWRPGQREQLALDLSTSATTELGGAQQAEIPLPPVHITIAIDAQSVSPEGELRYAWHVTGAAVRVEAGMSAEIADGMRAQVSPVEHMAGTGVETDQGLSKEVTVDPSSLDASASQSQMVVQVVQTLRDVAAPLPSEEVGHGARWQKLARLDARDAHVAQTDTFTLTSMKGDAGSLDDALAQTASPQTLAAPVAGGPAPRMESMLTSGQAATRFWLTRLVPQTAFEGTTQMVVSGQAAPSGARVTMNMRVKIALEGTLGAAR